MRAPRIRTALRDLIARRMARAFAAFVLAGTAMMLLFTAHGEEQKSETLRIGMVKVSLHTYWFCCFFNTYDPDLLETYAPGMHARNLQVKEVTLPLPGAEVVKVWDPDPEKARQLAATFHIPTVANSLEEMVSGIDGVMITDTRGDGSDHYELAKPFLEKGIPTYVDKPFADSIEAGRRIVELAHKTGTPMMSTSILRYVKGVEEVKAHLNEAGQIQAVVAFGTGHPIIYGIHTVEMLHSIMGPGIESVQNIGDEKKDILKIHYGDGRDAVAVIAHDAKTVFRTDVLGSEKHLSTGDIDRTGYQTGADGAMKAYLQMLRTKKPQVGHNTTLEILKVLHAGQQSLKTREPVLLKDL
jgi:virulence factor